MLRKRCESDQYSSAVLKEKRWKWTKQNEIGLVFNEIELSLWESMGVQCVTLNG